MIVHTLNMCAPSILCIFDNYFPILGFLNLDIFFHPWHREKEQHNIYI